MKARIDKYSLTNGEVTFAVEGELAADEVVLYLDWIRLILAREIRLTKPILLGPVDAAPAE